MAVKCCGLFINLVLSWNSISHAKTSKLLAIPISFKDTFSCSCNNLCLHFINFNFVVSTKNNNTSAGGLLIDHHTVSFSRPD